MEKNEITAKKAAAPLQKQRKKRREAEDIFYPVPMDYSPIRSTPPASNQEVVRGIVRQSVKVAYGLKDPNLWDYSGNYKKPKAVASDEQVATVMHLIESLQPADAIEAALASQFAISYVKAMHQEGYSADEDSLEMFEFGHKVLETLQKYKSKGAQQISVQYNVNQGQVLNIKTLKTGTNTHTETLEAEVVE